MNDQEGGLLEALVARLEQALARIEKTELAARVPSGHPQADTCPSCSPRPQPVPTTALPLSAREHDVLALIADGHRNAVIAARLHLSPKTVRNYVSALYRKLDVTCRIEAAIRARDAAITMDNQVSASRSA